MFSKVKLKKQGLFFLKWCDIRQNDTQIRNLGRPILLNGAVQNELLFLVSDPKSVRKDFLIFQPLFCPPWSQEVAISSHIDETFWCMQETLELLFCGLILALNHLCKIEIETSQSGIWTKMKLTILLFVWES